jgi:hypothetical protein
MRDAGRDVCRGLEIGVDIDQKLEGGARYRDKRPMAQKMWDTIMNTLQAIGALPRRPDRVWDGKHRKWINVGYLDDPPTARRSERKPFVVEWVKLPKYWIERLERARHLATYKLAHRILREAFRQQRLGGEIVLSATITGLSSCNRHRATRELTELGLIRTTQEGNGAVTVTELLWEADKPDPVRRGRNGK